MNNISDAELHRYQAMEAAIKWVLSQQVDDVCWRDVYEKLAKLVNVKYAPQLICDREKHLANCDTFIDSLRSGPYVPVYVEPVNQPRAAMILAGLKLRDAVSHVLSLPDDLPTTLVLSATKQLRNELDDFNAVLAEQRK